MAQKPEGHVPSVQAPPARIRVTRPGAQCETIMPCGEAGDRWVDDPDRLVPWPCLAADDGDVPVRSAAADVPAIDMYEQADEIVVHAELPGLSREQVEVAVTDATLTITGKKQKENDVRAEDYYCCDRSFGTFARILSLPTEVNAELATASFEDGLLELHLPKR